MHDFPQLSFRLQEALRMSPQICTVCNCKRVNRFNERDAGINRSITLNQGYRIRVPGWNIVKVQTCESGVEHSDHMKGKEVAEQENDSQLLRSNSVPSAQYMFLCTCSIHYNVWCLYFICCYHQTSSLSRQQICRGGFST